MGNFHPFPLFPQKELSASEQNKILGRTSSDDVVVVVVVVGADHDAVGGDDNAVGGDEFHFPFHLLLCLPVFPILPPPSKNTEKYFQTNPNEYFSASRNIFQHPKIHENTSRNICPSSKNLEKYF